MDWLLPLIGGLGIGSLLKSVVDHLFSRKSATRDRLYQEKREAYIGLLSALHQAAIEPSDKNSKNYALWQTRCQLFGSPEVARFAQAMVDTNDGPSRDRAAAFEGLISSMRDDLRQ